MNLNNLKYYKNFSKLIFLIKKHDLFLKKYDSYSSLKKFVYKNHKVL